MKTDAQKKILFGLSLLSKSLSLGFVLLGAMLLFTSCSSKLIVKSQPRQEEMIIDGYLDDWSPLTFTQLKQEGLAIGVKNDSDHLYVCMRIFDQAKASALMQSGFTVWLDASVSKKKTCGIRFPLGMPPRSMGSRSVNNRRGGTSFERDSVSRQLNILEIIEKGQENKRIAIHNPYGIDVAVAPEPTSGALVYELAVPITAPVVKILSFQARPGGMVGIGLEAGALATPMGSNGNRVRMPVGISLGMGGMGFGLGGMSGGGMYGGMYPGRGMMNRGNSTPSTTWVYATLAN